MTAFKTWRGFLCEITQIPDVNRAKICRVGDSRGKKSPPPKKSINYDALHIWLNACPLIFETQDYIRAVTFILFCAFFQFLMFKLEGTIEQIIKISP